MSYMQPHIGIFSAAPFFYSQQPSQPTFISSLPETRLNGSFQNTKNNNSVTQTIETKQTVVDREIIVLSSDSESDTETRSPVVSRKAKGKEKADVVDINKNLEDSASIIVDQTQTSNMDLMPNATSTFTRKNRACTSKNLLDGYDLMSNMENLSFFQMVNPVRVFLYILEDHNTIVELFDIIVDFARIYLEIYREDNRNVLNLYDPQTLIPDLIYCLKSKMKVNFYVNTSERFKKVELLARKAIEVIEQLKETG
ncbi:15495_t:CDS:2 [Funneliformis caledonium]|uniref:15495_t:CDS:1 n=1 Tax=Funneliformis caledonium TaxID=1117310 RepID=A0A9N9BCT8_9GLOM|nr:15495_t:CDS:2 [Funneliformis caledonium]